MGSSAYEEASVGFIEEGCLVEDIVSASLVVSVNNCGDRAHSALCWNRGEEFPILLAVKVSKKVLQVPLSDEFVTLGVVKKGRCVVLIPRVVIVQRIAIKLNDFWCDLILVAAAETAHVGGFAI